MSIFSYAQRYVMVGWQHRWKALLLAWVICLGGWTAIHFIPDQYRSSARIYAAADAILGQTLRGIAVDGAAAAQVDMLQRTLLSRPNLERLVARTELDQRVTSPAAREALLKDLARNIRITPQTRNLFLIEYTDREARMAQAVVQAVLNLFIESAANDDRQQMDNARGFIAQQVSTYEAQLREAEQRRADFRTRYIDLLPNDQLGGASRLEGSRGRINQLRGELQDAQARRNLTRQQLSATPAMLPGERFGGGGGGNSALADAERQLRELRLRLTDQHPDVAAARAMVADIRRNGSGGGGGGGGGGSTPPRPNPAHEQLQLRLIDAEAQIASLERQIRDGTAENARLEELARSAPQLQAQFQNLDRDYTVLRKQYEELLARREALQIAGAARTGADQMRLEVVEPPTVPTLPASPNRALLAAGVLVAGLGAGTLLVVLLATLDQGFYIVQDLRRLGLPVLGTISSMSRPRQWGAAMVFLAGFGLLFVAFGTVLLGGDTLLARLPNLVSRVFV